MVLLDGEEKVYIPFGKSSYLRGALNDQGTEVAVIFCHSWKLFGGSMNEILVLDMVKSFSLSSTSESSEQQRFIKETSLGGNSFDSMQHKQLTALRFNFPGLLQINRGIIDLESVIAASNYLLRGYRDNLKKPRPKKILLVGYTRGSLISGSASAEIPECIGNVMIGCPFAVQSIVLMFNSSYHLNQSCKRRDISRLFIHGTDDEYTSVRSLMKVINKHFSVSRENEKNDVTVNVFEGATCTHKFRKNERTDIINYIHQWIHQVL